jgi:hypothetical protein
LRCGCRCGGRRNRRRRLHGLSFRIGEALFQLLEAFLVLSVHVAQFPHLLAQHFNFTRIAGL